MEKTTLKGYSTVRPGLISSVRRALASKLRGLGFKSRPGTVSGPDTIIYNVGCSAKLNISFDVNLVTECKQGTFPFFVTLMKEVIFEKSCKLAEVFYW